MRISATNVPSFFFHFQFSFFFELHRQFLWSNYLLTHHQTIEHCLKQWRILKRMFWMFWIFWMFWMFWMCVADDSFTVVQLVFACTIFGLLDIWNSLDMKFAKRGIYRNFQRLRLAKFKISKIWDLVTGDIQDVNFRKTRICTAPGIFEISRFWRLNLFWISKILIFSTFGWNLQKICNF